MKKMILGLVLLCVAGMAGAGTIRILHTVNGVDLTYTNNQCTMLQGERPKLRPAYREPTTTTMPRKQAKCAGWALNQLMIGDEPNDIHLEVNRVPFICSRIVTQYVNEENFFFEIDCRSTFNP